MSLPCDGLRVLDLTWGMAGNVSAMILADYGASVVKVEPPGGDPFRGQPAWPFWNRGKASTVIDLRSELGAGRMSEFLARADVLIESFRPGVMDRLGLGYGAVRGRNPALIYCSITGFGSKGPYARRKGYEGIVAAATGRMREFEGMVDPPRPAFAAVPTASHGAAQAAVQGVLAALHVRRQSRRGAHVETSLQQANTPFDLVRWYAIQAAPRDELARDRLESWGALKANVPGPHYLTAVTADGVWLQFANYVPRSYVAQLNALGLTDLLADPRYTRLPAVSDPRDHEPVWEAVLERVREKTWAEWKAIFDAERDVCVEPFRRTADGFDHPQIRHNGHVLEIDHAEQPGPIVTMTETPACPHRGAPALGEPNGVDFERWTPAALAPAAPAPVAPLAGKLVLDFATFIATPFGSVLLADLGARVIKIEPPQGDESRYSAGRIMFFKTSAGKESLAVDLKAPEGREIVQRLLPRADIVLHNFRPGVPERLGIGYEQARTANPNVVYHYGASYGISGPYAFKPAMHPTAGAVAGGAIQQASPACLSESDASLPMDQLKERAWRLMRANEATPDPASALGLATGVLLGIQAQETRGVGQYQYTTMLLSNLYANADAGLRGSEVPARPEPDLALLGLGPLYRLYETSDGAWLFLAVVTEKDWRAFCPAVGHPEWLEDERFATASARGCHGDDLAAALAVVFRTRPADDWEAMLAEHDVAAARADRHTVASFAMDEPSNRAQGFVVPVTSAHHGTYLRYGPLVTLDVSPSSMRPTCEVGEHTRSILAELGFSDGEMLDLRGRGVVAWPDDETAAAALARSAST